MIIKAVILFLAFILLLGFWGKLRGPWRGRSSRRCKNCGAPLVGRGRCPCGRRT